MDRDLKQLISQMSLEEKAGLCSGLDSWRTKPVARLGIPAITMTDGPHGLRKVVDPDQLGLDDSIPATCFPSGAGLACSWDRALIERVGNALAEECLAEQVSILLGPAANIKRSPLCGRNFEYFSEDPYLSSEMAAHHIRGVQSRGVGSSLKHFCANNQEHRRLSVDAVIDERTLREIYLASFEGAVKQAEPWTVMCAYNKVNGEYCSENEYLLTTVLKEEWGHQGLVVSDWGAVDRREKALAAGLELEMPSSHGVGERRIVAAVKNGQLREEVLDRAVERLLRIIFRAADNRRDHCAYDRDAHHRLAGEVAQECMVLLKNEERILPLFKTGTFAIIGRFAETPRYQGGGSSHVHPTRLDNIREELGRVAGPDARFSYAAGYSLEDDAVDAGLLNEAKTVASQADVAVLFVGLPERHESEGFDREHLRLPENHTRLIEEVAAVQPNVVVVLCNGSPVEMPWIDKAKGVLEAYLGGQALGGAVARLLFGAANPCGKLAETFPKRLSDNPSYLNFPGEGDRVEYWEGQFVGYRYYDAKNIAPLFPFGHGLSYTTFEYSAIAVDKKELSDTELLNVTVKIRNTGSMAGKEIVQLYVRDVASAVIRPPKELKGFAKIALAPGEAKTVTFALDKRAFAYYNVDIKDWHVATGQFEILVGGSARDLFLKERVHVRSSVTIAKPVTRNSLVGDLLACPATKPIIQKLLKEFGEKNPLLGSAQSDANELAAALLRYLPLRALIPFGGPGAFDDAKLDRLIEQLNQSKQ